jgi:hypothetical protein
MTLFLAAPFPMQKSNQACAVKRRAWENKHTKTWLVEKEQNSGHTMDG